MYFSSFRCLGRIFSLPQTRSTSRWAAKYVCGFRSIHEGEGEQARRRFMACRYACQLAGFPYMHPRAHGNATLTGDQDGLHVGSNESIIHHLPGLGILAVDHGIEEILLVGRVLPTELDQLVANVGHVLDIFLQLLPEDGSRLLMMLPIWFRVLRVWSILFIAVT